MLCKMVLGKKHNQKDYEWGRQQEQKCIGYLNEHFNTSLTNAKSQYARWDFTDEKLKIEMKSRKGISIDKFSTTFLSEDKCRHADSDTYFVFNFVYNTTCDLSDLYFIRYDQEKFKNYLKKTVNNDWSLIEIPCKDLTHIVQEIL